MFESLLDRLRGKKKKNGNGDDDEADTKDNSGYDKKKKDNSEGAMLKGILTALGFKEDADEPSEEQVTERVTALTLAEGIVASIRTKLELSADATGDAFITAIDGLGKVAEVRANKEFRESKEYTEMVQTVKALSDGKLNAIYRQDTVKLTALPGTPDEIAERMFAIETGMGKAEADKTLAEWVRHNTANQQVISSGGRTGDERADEAVHPFEERMAAYAKEHEVTEQVAMARLAETDGTAFVQYEADKAAEYNAAL